MFAAKPRTVADVMTRRLATLHEDDTLGSLEEAMQSLRVRHLPVIDRAGKLVGLVSHADVWHAASNLLSASDADAGELDQVPVSRVMQTAMLTVEPEDALIDAGKLMWDSKVGCLPVVQADGTLVGILTGADFIVIALELLGTEIQKSDVEELAKSRARFRQASAASTSGAPPRESLALALARHL